MSVYRLSERSGGVIGTIGPIGGSGVFSLQERYALTADSYEDVSLYLKMNGANGSTTFYDSSLYGHTVTANGNAQISTAQSKFGGSSAAFDGSGDYLDSESSSQFAFGTGDFTVEFWLFPTSSSVTYRCIVDTRSTVSTNTGVGIFQYGLTLELYGNGLKLSSAANALTLNEWQHVVLARESGACQFYINGVASGSSATYSDDLTGQSVRMGVNKNGNNPYTGYIDSLRITKGIARYTANFTPPQREFLP